LKVLSFQTKRAIKGPLLDFWSLGHWHQSA